MKRAKYRKSHTRIRVNKFRNKIIKNYTDLPDHIPIDNILDVYSEFTSKLSGSESRVMMEIEEKTDSLEKLPAHKGNILSKMPLVDEILEQLDSDFIFKIETSINCHIFQIVAAKREDIFIIKIENPMLHSYLSIYDFDNYIWSYFSSMAISEKELIVLFDTLVAFTILAAEENYGQILR